MGKAKQSEEEQHERDKEEQIRLLEELATMEAERLKSLLFDFNILDKHIEILDSTIINTAWMKVKLDEARKAIKTSNVVIPYDNGGGQKGMRENPLFKGYENLFKSYMNGMKEILNVLPKQTAEVIEKGIEKPQTVLELVRLKHKKEA